MTQIAAAAPTPLLETAHNLLAAAWRRRFVIVVPILVLPVLGGVAGHFAPRMYESKMSILIQEPGKLNPFLADLSVKTDLKDRMPALSALLTSRHVLVDVAQDLGMLAKDATEVERNRVVSYLSTNVSVQLIGNEMVEMRYRSREPKGMDRVLTRIGERFMDRVDAPENSSMRDSVAFLGTQLKEANDRLAKAEQNLSDFKTSNSEQLPDLRTTNVQRLAQLTDQLSERQVQLSGAQAELTGIQSRLSQTDPVVGQMETQIVAARGELALLRARYTEEHSMVQAAERKIERLDEERAELIQAAVPPVPEDADRMWNMAAVATSRADGSQPLLVSQVALLQQARIHVDQLRSEVENLQGMVKELQTRVSSSGEVEHQLNDQEREVTVTAELVGQLRRRFDMAKVTGDLSRFQAPHRIAVIDEPTEPTQPMKPTTLLFTLGGLAAGIALGIGLAILMELMDTSVRTARQMQRLTGVPVLARIVPMERKWGKAA